MSTLIDSILFYIFATIFVFLHNISTSTVMSMLIALILFSISYYFDKKNVSLVTVGLFVIFTFFHPVAVLYLPFLIYQNYWLNPYILLGFFGSSMYISYARNVPGETHLSTEEYFLVFFLCLLSFILAEKSHLIRTLQKKNHDLMDTHSYVEQNLTKTQEQQRMEQDREIKVATLSERNRIAREIHDNVGHMLSRSILQLGAIVTINKDENIAEPLSHLKDTLDTAMTNIRESVHDLRDESLDLHQMILGMTKDFSNLNVKLDYDLSDHTPKDIKYCFLAITKEAMTNTSRHSDADKIEITLREHPALYQLLIEDNGTSSNVPEKIHAGMGLDNMRERVNALDGTITFQNTNGFRIFVAIRKPM